jgi:hypothetical protein
MAMGVILWYKFIHDNRPQGSKTKGRKELALGEIQLEIQ